ncbi:hypothetical protein Trydic_g23420 [Trypoxylus dichotomus]
MTQRPRPGRRSGMRRTRMQRGSVSALNTDALLLLEAYDDQRSLIADSYRCSQVDSQALRLLLSGYQSRFLSDVSSKGILGVWNSASTETQCLRLTESFEKSSIVQTERSTKDRALVNVDTVLYVRSRTIVAFTRTSTHLSRNMRSALRNRLASVRERFQFPACESGFFSDCKTDPSQCLHGPPMLDREQRDANEPPHNGTVSEKACY